MVSFDLIDALKQLEREKKFSMSTIIETMEAALVSAYKKNFGAAGNIRVVIDPERGNFRVLAEKCVTEEVTNSHTEISLEVARRVRPSIMPGDIVEVEVTPKDFGRIAAQTAKQVLMQRLREAERESIYEEFAGQEGKIFTAEVQRAERRNVYLFIGRAEALLPPTEQVDGESYRFGDRLKVLLLEVRRTTRTPPLVVSRSHPDLIRRLFELEVPEIQEGIVQVRAVAREPGARTKIAVSTSDENVDPVGACVGHRGSRVQAVVNELGDEKIDIIRWSEDPREFLQNALSPAKVSQVIANEDDHSAVVIVPEDQQSLAIGRLGQNVRLAARLTGWKIDIRTFEQFQAEQGAREGEQSVTTLESLAPEETLESAENLSEQQAVAVAEHEQEKLVTNSAVVEIGAEGEASTSEAPSESDANDHHALVSEDSTGS